LPEEHLDRDKRVMVLLFLNGPEPSKTQAWLSFLSSLIWQAIIVGLLVAYREQLGALFKKLTKLGFAGIEAQFQEESVTAIHTSSKVEVQKLGIDGFLTKAGVEELISDSGLLSANERTRESLLLFHTQFQRTWLVSTGKTLFCVLDDENTRESGQSIQWREATESIKQITTWKEGRRYAIDIGKHGSWLYSHYLHPNANILKEQVRRLLS
jgi:hypothetical protein